MLPVNTYITHISVACILLPDHYCTITIRFEH